MTTLLDLLYVALFAGALPAIDYALFWPAFRRRSQADPVRARTWLWAWAILSAWPVVGLGALLWQANERPWSLFGFSLPHGWRLWTAVALLLLLAAYHVYAVVALAQSAEARDSVRQQFGKVAAVLPHTRRELWWFGAVSLTAGFCEEFLFRGYLIWALAPWLTWRGAAAVSLVIFAVGHAYQGGQGVLRTGIVGALFTLVVAVFDSLWPAIAMHALLDLGQGTIAWMSLSGRESANEMSSAQSA